jgi:hypothetical protein
MKSSISFPAPNGFSAPEDSKPGQPFEVMATVVMGGDGLLTLSAVDGVPVANSEYDEEAENESSAESEAENQTETGENEIPPGEGFLMAIEKGASKSMK